MASGDFGRLWRASSVSLVGSECAATAGPLLALLVTRSPVFAGWIVAAQAAPTVLLPVVAGSIADRFDRRLVMMYCQVGRVVVAAILTIALLSRWQAEPWILLWALADGTFSTLFATAESALVPSLVSDEKQLPKAMAINEARGHMALLSGRPLAGLLFSAHTAVPFIVEFVTSLVSLGMISRISPTRTTQEARKPASSEPRRRPGVKSRVRKGLQEFAVGFRKIKSDAFLRNTMGVCASTNFLFKIVILLLVLRAEEYGLSSLEVGVLLAMPSLGGLVAAFVAPTLVRHVYSRWPGCALIVCVAIWWVMVFIIVEADWAPLWFVAWMGVGVVGVHLNVVRSTWQATSVEPHLLGRVASAHGFTTSGLVLPLGSLAGGYLLATLDVEGTGMVLMAAMLLMPALTVGLLRIDWNSVRVSMERRCRPADERPHDGELVGAGG